MASKYRKIDPRIWKDERFRCLTNEERLIAFYLLTAQSNRIGLFNFSPAMAAEDLETLPQTFLERFGKVLETLFWEYDATSRVLYLPKWWKYNPPENHNILIGNLKDIDDIPDSQLISKFCINTKYLASNLSETFTQTLAKRLPKGLPKPSPIQEQEQEQEQEQKKQGAERPSPSKQTTKPVQDKAETEAKPKDRKESAKNEYEERISSACVALKDQVDFNVFGFANQQRKKRIPLPILAKALEGLKRKLGAGEPIDRQRGYVQFIIDAETSNYWRDRNEAKARGRQALLDRFGKSDQGQALLDILDGKEPPDGPRDPT